jgi:polysaccharide biosynthesis transport protein
MNEPKNTNARRADEPHAGGMAVDDVYYILFRQKWVILICSALGILAAIAVLLIKPAQYQSEAKLLIRYVVEGKTPTPTANDSYLKSPDAFGSSILSTEVEILTSLDLVGKVVDAVGPNRIIGKSTAGVTNATNWAASLVVKNLILEPPTKGSVIPIIYQHPDPEVARAVLTAMISAYLKKHSEMHQPVGIYGEVLHEETERLQSELDKTDQALRAAKKAAGVISLDDAKKAATEEISRIRQELFTAEAELAEHQAAIPPPATAAASKPGATNVVAEIPEGRVREYRATSRLLQDLFTQESHDQISYPPGSPFLKQTEDLITQTEQRKKKLEKDFPGLSALVVTTAPAAGQQPGTPLDVETEAMRVKELQAKTNFLNLKLAKVQEEASHLEQGEGPIRDMQRRKDTQEANLKYFLQSLEQNRIDSELGTGKGSEGISIIQSPSPAVKKRSKTLKKMLVGTLAGGVFLGLGLAFFIEKILDGSVRRPGDIEKKLRLPLFISIPERAAQDPHQVAASNGRHRLLNGNADSIAITFPADDATAEADPPQMASWDPDHSLRPFYEGLRDRLIVNFEIRNLQHKPKLVAVTSCNKGAGVSTIAAGLAASLSETGDGNVLLVDMNLEQGTAQQFYKGQPGCGLDDALEAETMNHALIQGNLYVASECLDNDKLPRVLPRRFANLMPKLKASDYDYIIFDMPPVSQTSMTPRLAGLMDMVLLVLESEKTNLDVVRRANAMLAESKANVSTVLNKTHTYIPPQLHREFLNDT